MSYTTTYDASDTRVLTHLGRVMHICVGKLTIIGSDNGLSPGRRQAIIWTNAGILLIRTLGTNSNDILSEIHAFSFKKMHLKMSSAKWRLFCIGLNVLKTAAAMILPLWDSRIFVFLEEGFTYLYHLRVENLWNMKIYTWKYSYNFVKGSIYLSIISRASACFNTLRDIRATHIKCPC